MIGCTFTHAWHARACAWICISIDEQNSTELCSDSGIRVIIASVEFNCEQAIMNYSLHQLTAIRHDTRPTTKFSTKEYSLHCKANRTMTWTRKIFIKTKFWPSITNLDKIKCDKNMLQQKLSTLIRTSTSEAFQNFRMWNENILRKSSFLFNFHGFCACWHSIFAVNRDQTLSSFIQW